MNTPEQTFQLNESLEKNNITHIKDIEQINNIFDIEALINRNIVDLKTTTKNTIILFDTPVYNSCYVLDELNKYIEKIESPLLRDTVEECNILYSDNIKIHESLFKPYLGRRWNDERPVPMILIITVKDNEICIIEESFFPLNSDTFTNVFHIITESCLQE